MKTFFALAAVTFSLVTGLAYSTQVFAGTPPEVDDAVVAAKIDARLHELLRRAIELERSR